MLVDAIHFSPHGNLDLFWKGNATLRNNSQTRGDSNKPTVARILDQQRQIVTAISVNKLIQKFNENTGNTGFL
jgi:hypothetical protein